MHLLRAESVVATQPATRDVDPRPWGDASDGLTARLTTREASPTMLWFEVRNITDRALVIVNAGLWTNHCVTVVSDADGSVPPFTPRGHECAAAFAPDGIRRKSIPIELAAREIHLSAEAIDLREHFVLAEGRYRVTMEYHDGDVHVVSNRLLIDVAEK